MISKGQESTGNDKRSGKRMLRSLAQARISKETNVERYDARYLTNKVDQVIGHVLC